VATGTLTMAAGTQSVKLEGDVVESARIVAAYKGGTITALLSDILRPILAEMERDEAAKRAKATAPRPKRARPEGS
jgi:hypothetical protein